MTKKVIQYPKIDLDGVKGVLIDIDDTLYPYEYSHHVALTECYKKFQVLGLKKEFDEEWFFKIYREKRSQVTASLSPQGACRSRFFAFQAMFEEVSIDAPYQIANDFTDLYWSFFVESMAPSEEAVSFLESCKELAIKVCAVSDMLASTQVTKIKRLGLTSYISYLVTSEEAGEEKPSEKMYQLALQKLNLKSDEVVMIGDHPVKDIEGANKQGIKAYQVIVK